MLSSRKIALIQESLFVKGFRLVFTILIYCIFFLLPSAAYVIISKSLISIIILLLVLSGFGYIFFVTKKNYIGRIAYIDLQKKIIGTIDKGYFKFQIRETRFHTVKKISLNGSTIRVMNKSGEIYLLSIETNHGTYDLGKYGRIDIKKGAGIAKEISNYFDVPVEYTFDGQPASIDDLLESSGFFSRVKARIKKTEVYQIYFVRAQKNSFSEALVFLFIICSIVGHFGLVSFLNPPIKPDLLKISQGYVEKYTEKTKRNVPSIKIRNERGEIEKYILYAPDELKQKLNSIRGELITIYYADGIDLFLRHDKSAEKIIYKDTYIFETHPSVYGGQEMLYEGGKKVFIFCAVTAFISLFIVYLRHR